MQEYLSLEDHGLIGDLQTAALVARDGTIDWFCAPRFDSPSIFAALLDRRRGGYFRISPDGINYVSKQLYLPDTPILITRFISPDGVGELIDFMPVAGDQVTDQHRLVRMLRVIRGSMRFRIECRPRFNYGRTHHDLELRAEGAAFRSSAMTLTVNAVHPVERFVDDSDIHDICNDLLMFATLGQGDTGGMVVETASTHGPRAIPPDEVESMFQQTHDYWRRWLGRSSYSGRWREMVERSAITLKLMTYAPTGAMIAAPTAALPEKVGGTRNWDYRYTWIRDTSFSVHALLGLGFTEEASRYTEWLDERVHEAGDNDVPLKIMYRVDGTPVPPEEILDTFEGYRGSGPVRVGNSATDQLQLDIHGEVLYAMHVADEQGIRASHEVWRCTAKVVDWLCDNWNQPDAGIWESRGHPRNYTYTRMMSWVAFDRAIRLAARHGRPGNTIRWGQQRDAIYNQIMGYGYDPSRRSFVQSYGESVLDAALLTMPSVGLVTPTDPMWQSTLRAIEDELVSDSLVYRYDPAASPDGLPGDEGTFNMCTFWYVEALACAGRLDDARLAFEKMLTFSSHLGLYAEEIASSGEQTGNFPQAFSHLSLINTAAALDQLLDRQRKQA
ncbi:glycoside hydrolase family 15 protein [Micromonospora sp. NPDC005113]